MKDFKCDSVLETLTYHIEFQIRKHGSYGGATTVEEAVDELTNFELLELIAKYLEPKTTSD